MPLLQRMAQSNETCSRNYLKKDESRDVGRPKTIMRPAEAATLAEAKDEIDRVAKWARQMGYVTIAPRLEWASSVIVHNMDQES